MESSMLTELIAPFDGVSLARSVRSIAARAQRTLKRPADPGEARDLLDAIVALENAAKARSYEDLGRWLSSLRRRIETHGRSVL
jgi:hypothetical protein